MSFCGNCGAPLLEGTRFCAKCGAQVQTLQAAQPNPSQAAQQAGGIGPKRGIGAGAKLAISAFLIIFVGGIAAAFYVAHKVSQKYHEVKAEVMGAADSGASPADAQNSSSTLGDACRFLSKEDVSKAIGVEILRTQSEDNGCSYIAKGTQVDLMAKHAAAMAGDMGADKNAQQFAQAYAGIIGRTSQGEKHKDEPAPGEGPVFGFSLDQNAAEEQMRLNAAVLGNLGPKQGLPSIGDQAFVTGDGIMLVRKGKTLVRIMYLTCPCGVKQVIPLAQKLAASL